MAKNVFFVPYNQPINPHKTRSVTIATYEFESTLRDRQAYFAPSNNLLRVWPTPGNQVLGRGALGPQGQTGLKFEMADARRHLKRKQDVGC